jgi:hypothetical protein
MTAMLGRRNLQALSLTLAISVLLVGLVGYNLRVPEQRITVEAAGLPVDEIALFSTVGFRSLWKSLVTHGTPLYDTIAADPESNAARLTEFFDGIRCFSGGSLNDFSSYGFNESREAILGIYDSNEFVALLPVRDQAAFERMIQRSRAPRNVWIGLQSADESRTAARLTVDAATISPGKFCGPSGEPVRAGESINFGTDTDFGPKRQAWILVAHDPRGTTEFKISCSAADDQGRSIPCSCTLYSEDMTFENQLPGQCSATLAPSESAPDEARQEEDKDYVLVSGRKVRLYRLFKMYVAFNDGGYAVLAPDVEMLKRSLEAPQRRLEFEAGSEIVRAAAANGGGALIGHTLIPGPGVVGKASIELVATPDAFEVQTRIRLQAGNATILRSLFSGEPTTSVAIPRGAVAAIGSPGSYGQDLLAFINAWYPDFRAGLTTSLGDFSDTVDLLTKADNASDLRLILLGFQDGIPVLTASLRTRQTTADSLLSSMQLKLKSKREAAIVAAALKKAGNPNASVAQLVTDGVLAAEPGTNWNDYAIAENGSVERRKGLPETVSPIAYSGGEIGTQKIVYLAPAYTRNDALIGGDNADPAVTKALEDGHFRLASMYHDGMLWLADDKAALELLLTDARFNFTATRQVPEDSGAGTVKLAVFIAPDAMIDLGQSYPNKKVADTARQYRPFQNYSDLSAVLSVDPPHQEVTVRVKLSH